VSRHVRASEIGAFAFCERAWGYAARGEPSERQPDLRAGQRYHERRLLRASVSLALRRLGLGCMALAVAALAIALTR